VTLAINVIKFYQEELQGDVSEGQFHAGSNNEDKWPCGREL
jgi:hypothetical protein